MIVVTKATIHESTRKHTKTTSLKNLLKEENCQPSMGGLHSKNFAPTHDMTSNDLLPQHRLNQKKRQKEA
jgi:hypothetical protein